jgi:arabinose-5-phosphate isomerase
MYTEYAKEVLALEARAIRGLIERIDKAFERAVALILNCTGRVVVTGLGKAGIIGQKVSATLASTGTPSLWFHPAEALHGDLGRVIKDDILIMLSNSGETEEIVRLIDPIKKIGAPIIAITGNKDSTLARNCDLLLDMGRISEACPLGLAPSASTTAMLALGDALALTVLKNRDFGPDKYAFYHPGGALGRRLLRVQEVMRTGPHNPIISQEKTVREALFAITEARAGAVSVIDEEGRLAGIFTDGDLRRHLQAEPNVDAEVLRNVMTKRPKTLRPERLASEALRILKENKIDELPVIDDEGRPIGMVDVQDILDVELV